MIKIANSIKDIYYILLLACTMHVSSAHTFEDIDLRFYQRINLKPRCDAIAITYVTGESVPLQAICKPFKLAVDQPDGWGNNVTFWEDRSEGPKIDMQNGVALAKAVYALEINTASSAYAFEVDAAISSCVVALAFCFTDYLFGSDSFDECWNTELGILIDNLENLQQKRAERLGKAITDANESIDSFIEAYSRCRDLDALVVLWEDYWAGSILK